MYFA